MIKAYIFLAFLLHLRYSKRTIVKRQTTASLTTKNKKKQGVRK